MSMLDASKLAAHRFEVGRALRAAHHLSSGDTPDTAEAVRDLARAVVALSQAVDDLLQLQERELEARV